VSKIIELREKRAKVWEQAKAFLDEKRGEDGLLSAEDTKTYEKMEAEVVSLGKEVERLERQAAIDLELSRPTSQALTGRPTTGGEEDKTGRASGEYEKALLERHEAACGKRVRSAIFNCRHRFRRGLPGSR